MKKPHILIFNPDQWRGDVLGHMGNPAAMTPNLDRFAETEAVSFRNAFCQNPVCTPSRCSFMTGWYPHVRGHRTLQHMLQPDEPCLLERLRREGYCVWWGGKNDLVPGQNGYDRFCDVKFRATQEDFARWGHMPKPNMHGVQEWRGKPGSDTFHSFYAGRLDTGNDSIYCDSDWANVLGAIDFIQSAPKDKPLCIFLPLEFPHPPYCVEEPWFSAIDRSKIPPRIPAPSDWSGKPSLLQGIWERQGMQGWTEDRWTELRATYYGMCARTDHLFGLTVKALRDAGIYNDTALFFFSDHGDFTGDYGLVEKTQNTFEDCLTRVPLLVKPPKEVPVQPGIRDAMVELCDFPATAFALADLEFDYTQFGRSLLPVIAGDTDEHRDAVFCEGGRLEEEEHCKEPGFGPEDSHKLYWPRASRQMESHLAHTKAVMCRTKKHKYVRRLYESDEFYDLQDDPGETVNRIDDPALFSEIAGLKDRLLTFFLETGDAVPFAHDRRR